MKLIKVHNDFYVRPEALVCIRYVFDTTYSLKPWYMKFEGNSFYVNEEDRDIILDKLGIQVDEPFQTGAERQVEQDKYQAELEEGEKEHVRKAMERRNKVKEEQSYSNKIMALFRKK